MSVLRADRRLLTQEFTFSRTANTFSALSPNEYHERFTALRSDHAKAAANEIAAAELAQVRGRGHKPAPSTGAQLVPSGKYPVGEFARHSDLQAAWDNAASAATAASPSVRRTALSGCGAFHESLANFTFPVIGQLHYYDEEEPSYASTYGGYSIQLDTEVLWVSHFCDDELYLTESFSLLSKIGFREEALSWC